MKIKIGKGSDGLDERKFREIEGPEARAVIKSVVKDIMGSILIPEPPFTTATMRECFEALREYNPIWSANTDDGYPDPDATIIFIPKPAPTIAGIIHADGTYEAVTEEGKNFVPPTQEPKP